MSVINANADLSTSSVEELAAAWLVMKEVERVDTLDVITAEDFVIFYDTINKELVKRAVQELITGFLEFLDKVVQDE